MKRLRSLFLHCISIKAEAGTQSVVIATAEGVYLPKRSLAKLLQNRDTGAFDLPRPAMCATPGSMAGDETERLHLGERG